MAAVKGKNNSSAKKRTSTAKGQNGRKSVHRGKRKVAKKDNMFRDEVTLVTSLVVSLLLILSNFNLSGIVGKWINSFTFGMVGFLAFLLPFFLFFSVAFGIANRGNKTAYIKIITAALSGVVLAAIIQLIQTRYPKGTRLIDVYLTSAEKRNGGGLIGGLLLSLIKPLFGLVGSYVVLFGIMAVLIVLFTGKSLFKPLGQKSEAALLQMKEMKRIRQEEAFEQSDEEEVLPKRKARIISFQKNKDQSENSVDTKETVVENQNTEDTAAGKRGKASKKKKDGGKAVVEMQEITPAMKEDFPIQEADMGFVLQEARASEPEFMKAEDISVTPFTEGMFGDSNANNSTSALDINTQSEIQNGLKEDDEEQPENAFNMDNMIQIDRAENFKVDNAAEENGVFYEEEPKDIHVKQQPEKKGKEDGEEDISELASEMNLNQQTPIKEYVFPPLDLLAKPKGNVKGVSERDLKETALKLQKTLESFGVGVTVTNVSCGPSVTRYELLPEQGVKVSRITGLADDIKLNLAAADIRIEAPIPGKAAVGIEVPNKDNATVLFRELIDSKEFKGHASDIAFAVGKDIGGQTIVTDIAKMPHLLIAGATGSGKSVCINTLIMSILYKANPSDVKMIMVDPKVVELSVYNGIPHLLIPVVTDPKKASAALNWAVMEMTERYKKFADLGVRDVKGYNDKVATVAEYQDERYQKLPQIVIIVDELADLMMVAPGEVEDAICRLAQMARAAGLHLIIATQRPSVNVITGLIKANIPSRIAFSVSSAIDSRTIIDGSGAEKLLGKGDMLFFPSGYPKPVRVQGAFISDKEVSEVVRFLAETNNGAEYSEEVAGKIANAQSGESSSASGGGSERDDYFIEAGKFIIDKDKASIGMLQRVYKIGFNRAARIMDQLAEAGVVGPEEGTKPRKILMSLEEFEQYVDEYY